MTENLIKDVKKIQQALINKESVGDEFEEKMEAIHKFRRSCGLSEGCTWKRH